MKVFGQRHPDLKTPLISKVSILGPQHIYNIDWVAMKSDGYLQMSSSFWFPMNILHKKFKDLDPKFKFWV